MKDTLPIEHKTNLWLLLQANPAQGCPDSVNLVPVYIPSLLRLVPPLLTVQGAYPPVPVPLHSPTASAKLFLSYPCLQGTRNWSFSFILPWFQVLWSLSIVSSSVPS